jgi:hypothetical protein
MAYKIKKSDNSTLTIISADTVDSVSTSLDLFGRGKRLWGGDMNENLVHMLEHFADSSEPLNPIQGQIWYDKSSDVLKYNASTTSTPIWFQLFAGIVSSPPAFLFNGDTNINGDAGITGKLTVTDSNAACDSPTITAQGPNGPVLYLENTSGGSPTDAPALLMHNPASGTYPYTIVSNRTGEIISVERSATETTCSTDSVFVIDENGSVEIFSDQLDVLKLNSAMAGNDVGIIEFYTDDTDPTVRTGYIGYPTTGALTNDNFVIEIERSGVSPSFRINFASGTNLLLDDGTTLGFQYIGSDWGGSGGTPVFEIRNSGFEMRFGQHDQVTRGNTGQSRAIVKDTGSILTFNYPGAGSGDFKGIKLGRGTNSTVDVDGNVIRNLTKGILSNDATTISQLPNRVVQGFGSYAVPYIGGYINPGHVVNFTTGIRGIVHIVADIRSGWTLSTFDGFIRMRLSTGAIVRTTDNQAHNEGFIEWEVSLNYSDELSPNTAYTVRLDYFKTASADTWNVVPYFVILTW